MTHNDVSFQINNDKSITLVQCKNYSNTIKVKDLSGFSYVMANHIEKKGSVYYTYKISRVLKETNINKKIKFYKIPFDPELSIQTDGFIKMYDYQQEIYNKYLEFYKDNNKSILVLPCGTGKTLLSCFISSCYDIVIFISPLKQFAQQNLDKYKEYYPDRKGILIDSDETRNLNNIYLITQSESESESLEELSESSESLGFFIFFFACKAL